MAKPKKIQDRKNKRLNQAKLDKVPYLGPRVTYSKLFSRLIKVYHDYHLEQQLFTEVGAIHVDEIASSLARFYEKVRKIVDWKEKHLERRAAIERILKRKMIGEISGLGLTPELSAAGIAEPLVLELIRAGHFPNDQIPRSKIVEVERVLDKYIYILKNNPHKGNGKSGTPSKKRINLYNWVTEIATCEIEETLDPHLREKALIGFMAQTILEKIRLVPENVLKEDEKIIQVYVATYRTLFHLDNAVISYYLIKAYWPQWSQAPENLIEDFTDNIFSIQKKIDKDLNHPAGNKFFNLCEKYDTVFLILGDVLNSFTDTPSQIKKKLINPELMIKRVKKAYNQRLATLKKRLFRAAIYSTLSIFVAGGLTLFIFEIPLAKLVYGEWRFLAIVVDLMLPTTLMALLVMMIKTPKEGNIQRLIKEVVKVAYKQERSDLYEINVSVKKGRFLGKVTGLLYLLGAAASLALVFWMFQLAKVPVTSLYIDTINVAMVVFAALVIRHRAKELTIEEKPSFWEFTLDILSVPMAKIGQWVANKWREYNVVSVFFTALVDMPFSSFIRFIESWRNYLNERKAEIH